MSENPTTSTEANPQDIDTTSFQPSRKELLLEVVIRVLVILVLYFLADSIIGRVRVFNISMYPTVVEGELVVVNKLAYKLGEMERGDIITFHFPLEPEVDYIKRLIGLPGDVVEVEDQQVRVNGTVLHEPYIVTPPEYEGSWTVPQGSIFALGDNRNDSADSHVWGFVPIENIIGKVLVVYWPVTHIRILSHADVMSSP